MNVWNWDISHDQRNRMTDAEPLSDTYSVPESLNLTEYHYVISGLQVRSTIELPSAICSETPPETPDVVIVEGDVPEAFENPERGDKLWSIEGQRFLFRIPQVMHVLVEDGRKITLKRFPDAQQGDVVLFLLGTSFAILLQQRGRVVLHASAVAVGDSAMLFCGPSGAGKSTLAAMLSRRGFPLLNDDVCNLSKTANGQYEVYPDGRMLKLWAESMEHLQVEATEEHRIRESMEKFYLTPETVDLTPRRVGGVYMIYPLDAGEAPQLEPLSAVEGMVELMRNAYRPMLVHAMEMQPSYFEACVSLIRNGGLYRLKRAKDFSRADEVLELLEENWNLKAIEIR